MAHTPGPWEPVKRPNDQDGYARWYVHQKSATIDGGYFCEVMALHSTAQAHDTARDNARLIAAAPDLLGAITSIFPADDWRRYDLDHAPDRITLQLTVTRDEMIALRDAIAKTEAR